MLKKWSDFRRRQREILSASNAATPIGQNGEADPQEALETRPHNAPAAGGTGARYS